MTNMESSQAGSSSSFVNVSNSPSGEFSLFSEKASFMLENDTPTYSSNDTLSFVVLQSAVESYIDIDQKSKSIDSSSLIESLNSSEIHEKLSELLQENMKLKETLKQNNIAMKQQFNILASWKEKMTKVQENHKHKFEETLELVRLQMKCAMEDASLKSSYDMPSVSEVQNPKSFSMLDMSPQETEELCNSTQKYEKLPTDLNEQLSVQDNQLSMTKSDQKTESASTSQPAIESPLLREQGATSNSYVSNYFDQSTTPNTPEHVETVNTCPNCVKCALKNEEIEALKETIVQLEHRLQSAIDTEGNILRTTLLNQQAYVESLESKLEKWEEYKILSETQLAAYEEDFQLERQQKDLLKQENNKIYETLMKHEADLES